MSITKRVRLHVPAGTLECAKVAVDCGADAVYFGFDTPSNLRNFRNINLSYADGWRAVEYIRAAGKKALVAVNNYPQMSDGIAICFEAIDQAAAMGADSVIVSDLALLDYARNTYPQLGLNLSVQAGACSSETIRFYVDSFKIGCVVLPRVLTLKDICNLRALLSIDLEVFAFGSLCINREGSCHLSSYITGESTNTIGTCSAPRYLTFHQTDRVVARINGKAIQAFSYEDIQSDQYLSGLSGQLPKEELHQWGNHFLINRRQLCKAQYVLDNAANFRLNDFVYLNTLEILPGLIRAGVNALKVEGRQRNASYVRDVTTMFRNAIDAYYEAHGGTGPSAECRTACARQFPGITPATACYLRKHDAPAFSSEAYDD